MSTLPIESVLDALREALSCSRNVVLHAPPGAGKTTRVPLALLDAPWLKGRRLIMLEPRRLAARAAARHMASRLGEAVGGTVGYRTRLDTRVGPRTRVEVVTEGVLTRMLQADPGLAEVGLVIFDEFHERSLAADLGLALCLDAQSALREDLRLLVMSATLEVAAVAELLGGAPVLHCEGRNHPVEVRYSLRRPANLEAGTAAAVRRALSETRGSLLVFLPGAGEIRRVQRLLESAPLGPGVRLAPLYGDLPPEAQDAAIGPPAPGERKVVLATSIAETSLTIEGIEVVIDAGLARTARLDPRTGMTRLETQRLSRASAEQRCGRAGRLGPGLCLRLWSEHEHASLPARTEPEILQADLASLALELAEWGVADPATLRWLDPPPAAALAQARDLLTRLGALDAAGRITAHGRAMAALPLHPRLAHMLLAGRELGLGALACDLAALLSERDPLRRDDGPREADLRLRLEALWAGARGEGREAAAAVPGYRVDARVLRRAARNAEQWRHRLGIRQAARDPNRAGELLALAYPDRIGRRRPGETPHYLLSGGRGARLASIEPMAQAPYLVAAELDDAEGEARIFLAAPLEPEALERVAGDRLRWEAEVRWDRRAGEICARRVLRLDALELREEPLPEPDPQAVTKALLQGLREQGLQVLPWTRELREWQQRVLFLRALDLAAGDKSAWPDVSDAALSADLEHWLTPYLAGIRRMAELKRLDLDTALKGLLDWERQRELDRLAPTHLSVPSGSRIRLDYSGEVPVLAVRLQELFGLAETPRVAGGRVPVLLHLLSPARRPVQVTRDLAGFWRSAYHEVRKDLKGRYPKHPWPEDPLTAPATRHTKRRGKGD